LTCEFLSYFIACSCIYIYSIYYGLKFVLMSMLILYLPCAKAHSLIFLLHLIKLVNLFSICFVIFFG
jgi:hypothetical protein